MSENNNNEEGPDIEEFLRRIFDHVICNHDLFFISLSGSKQISKCTQCGLMFEHDYVPITDDHHNDD